VGGARWCGLIEFAPKSAVACGHCGCQFFVFGETDSDSPRGGTDLAPSSQLPRRLQINRRCKRQTRCRPAPCPHPHPPAGPRPPPPGPPAPSPQPGVMCDMCDVPGGGGPFLCLALLAPGAPQPVWCARRYLLSGWAINDPLPTGPCATTYVIYRMQWPPRAAQCGSGPACGPPSSALRT
jgi:hypothetical protein